MQDRTPCKLISYWYSCFEGTNGKEENMKGSIVNGISDYHIELFVKTIFKLIDEKEGTVTKVKIRKRDDSAKSPQTIN